MSNVPRELMLELTTDASGDATATTPALTGNVERIVVDYGAGVAITADVIVTDGGSPALTILTLADSNTDAVIHPRIPVHDAAGAAIAGEYAKAYLNNTPLTVTVAQGGDTQSVSVRILVIDANGPAE